MASTCSQPIVYSYPNIFTVEAGFQFLKPPPSLNTSLFGCAARFNLSAMDVPASINGDRLRASLSVDQPFPPACAAELSKDDDDDFFSVRRILALLKRVIEVVNLTCNETDDGNHTEVSWLRYT
jgi:hypothetical protein